ncbi:MAG: elongation factor P [Candidatus Pacebacteria bacterium]|nr:elongation factor P [Candidatus Paceibacterota bacterium]
MISTSDFEKGMVIKVNNEPWQIINFEFYKPGKGGAVMRTQLKNFQTDKVLEKTFRSGDRFEELEVDYQDAVYLYSDRKSAVFEMKETQERISFNLEKVGDLIKFLKEKTEVSVIFLEGKPVSIKIPIKMELLVVEAPDAVKGNTVSGALKTVILENGLKINTPLFIKKGDRIIINTETGQYAGRAKEEN